MTEDKIKQYNKIKQYTGEWIRLPTKLDASLNDAPITLYEFIKLREENY